MRALLIFIFALMFVLCSSPKNNKSLSKADLANSEVPIPKLPCSPKSYIAYKTDSPLKIDGIIDESEWKAAKWTDHFIDIEGDLKPLPLQNTRVKMLWDDEYFYIAVYLEESHVWAKLKKKDSVIFYDNDFEVFIDPDGDTHRYFEMEMNAFNTIWDLLLIQPYRDEGGDIWSWDLEGMNSAVHIDGTINNASDIDKGWSLELAIPWKTLAECAFERRGPKDGEKWRVNFSRVQWQTVVENGEYIKIQNPKTGKSLPEYNWVWSPQGVINMHYPEMWGYVQFSENIVGREVAKFVEDEFAEVKWALRMLYYKQRAYKDAYGVYCSDISALGLEKT